MSEPALCRALWGQGEDLGPGPVPPAALRTVQLPEGRAAWYAAHAPVL